MLVKERGHTIQPQGLERSHLINSLYHFPFHKFCWELRIHLWANDFSNWISACVTMLQIGKQSIIPSLSNLQTPWIFLIFCIEFFLILWEAWMWKNFEFSSPNCSHKTFDLWSHNLSSLSIKSVISSFSSLTKNCSQNLWLPSLPRQVLFTSSPSPFLHYQSGSGSISPILFHTSVTFKLPWQ